MAGDVMLGRLIDQLFPIHNIVEEERLHAMSFLKYNKAAAKSLSQLQHKYVWGNTLPLIRSADVKIINLETSVTTCEEKWPNKAFNYRMHPVNLQALKEVDIDYCSLANNHTLDFGYKGLFDTMTSLTAQNISWSGVGNNLDEAMKPAYFERKNISFCCYSFADHPIAWAATKDKPGINIVDVECVTQSKMEQIAKRIQDDKTAKEADIRIASIHWGSNYEWSPPKRFQQFARDLIDMGIDIIHGHSAHHIQGIEFYKGKPIMYGLGDFVDDYAIDDIYRNDLGFAYFLNIKNKKVDSIELHPTKISYFSVNKLTPEHDDYKWLKNKMTPLCASFGTVVTDEDGFLEIKNRYI
jgi:poly-gamma-glutamate capsule biosynthesis protein CapA/YwtB (metallophosphatase superfamily)